MARIGILGAGISGTGSAVLAKVKGHEVFLSDSGKIRDEYRNMLEQHGIEYEEGSHDVRKILSCDEIIKSPGIPDSNPLVARIREAGIPVISEIEFAGRYDRSRRICITGSNGKTTTTSLVYHILKTAGFNAGLGGNIGKGYALQVATEEFDWFVLELSSFQLDGMYGFKADIAVLTNITPDHLDRYGYRLENYAMSKLRILQNMDSSGVFIRYADDRYTCRFLEGREIIPKDLPFSTESADAPGGFFLGNRITARVSEDDSMTVESTSLPLKGKHNMCNCLAAAIAARSAGVSWKDIETALMTFEPVEHRLEPVMKVNGVDYINDSKATNVDSSWYALESMKQPVIWIAGGTDKGNDYTPLYGFVKEKVKLLICMGVDNAKLHECFGDKVPEIIDVLSAEEAVRTASSHAAPGDCVLLSPACASFDLFRNYEDRGRRFKQAVKDLKEGRL